MARTLDQTVREQIGNLVVENCSLRVQLDEANETIVALKAALGPDRVEEILGGSLPRPGWPDHRGT